jgi:hypothetical protein
VKCRGNAESAGRDPGGACRFCGDLLVDAAGDLIVEREPEVVIATDLRVLAICEAAGHVFEGVYDVAADQCRGRCSRCAIVIAIDGRG